MGRSESQSVNGTIGRGTRCTDYLPTPVLGFPQSPRGDTSHSNYRPREPVNQATRFLGFSPASSSQGWPLQRQLGERG